MIIQLFLCVCRLSEVIILSASAKRAKKLARAACVDPSRLTVLLFYSKTLCNESSLSKKGEPPILIRLATLSTELSNLKEGKRKSASS